MKSFVDFFDKLVLISGQDAFQGQVVRGVIGAENGPLGLYNLDHGSHFPQESLFIRENKSFRLRIFVQSCSSHNHESQKTEEPGLHRRYGLGGFDCVLFG